MPLQILLATGLASDEFLTLRRAVAMNSCFLRALAFAVFGFGAAILAPGAVEAQIVSPAQVTPRDLRPAASSSGTIALPGAAGLQAPPNAASLSITLGQVIVEGDFPELQSQSATLTDRLRGKRITVADIYAVANAIEQAYAAAGYILVRVVVPPQKLDKGGALRLVIVDGFVEGVDVKGVAESQRSVVAARMASLIGRRHVTLDEIERRLLLASDVPRCDAALDVGARRNAWRRAAGAGGHIQRYQRLCGRRQSFAQFAGSLRAQLYSGEQRLWTWRTDLWLCVIGL
jgi:hemolysin activation/secretion protein